MTKLIVAFRNFAKAPKNDQIEDVDGVVYHVQFTYGQSFGVFMID